jgi:putative flippase GtrA
MRFFSFCLVGAVVFCLDLLLFSLLNNWLNAPYLARMYSFWVSICLTWLGNSLLTFGDIYESKRRITKFLKYFLACHFSGILNLSVYAGLVYTGLSVYLAFATGVLVGLLSNFKFAKSIMSTSATTSKLQPQSCSVK